MTSIPSITALHTKYGYKMFKNSKTVGIIRDALYDVAERHGMAIKEMSFGEDFAHVHMKVSIQNTMSISYAVQLLKGYSSYKVFKEMPPARIAIFQRAFLDRRIQQWKCRPKR